MAIIQLGFLQLPIFYNYLKPFSYKLPEKKMSTKNIFFSPRSRPPKKFRLFSLKNVFRDNGQSLGHAFSKPIELHLSGKIEGRENIFSDSFSASDPKTNFLKI